MTWYGVNVIWPLFISSVLPLQGVSVHNQNVSRKYELTREGKREGNSSWHGRKLR
jgi:hypothetical protein